MNIKKLLATVIVGVFILGFAGIAAALSNDINIYGSSAQLTVWKSIAPAFLTSEGCSNVSPVYTITKDSNHAVVTATCSGKQINFRITAKASFDGPLAVSGNTTNPNLTYTNSETLFTENCTSSSCTNTSTSCTGYTRPMIAVSSCSGTTCTATDCETVTGGTSDVEASSITQSSQGQLKGPNTAGGETHRNFTGAGAIGTNGIVYNASGKALTDQNEIVVPFAFWVSSDVAAAGITNLTQADVRMIFSGQIQNWTDLGFSYSHPINVCWRHAGSGTSATLALTEMNTAILQVDEIVNGAGQFNYYFNDGTGDEENCVNTLTGAVGYFDADKASSLGAGSSYPNISGVSFNGVPAYTGTLGSGASGTSLKNMIENNEYDFWTVENLYYDSANTDMVTLASWLSSSTNHATALSDSWYAWVCSLNYTKGGDALYPTYQGANPSCAP